MSIAALNWAWNQQCPNATSKLVLIALADKANEDGECWPGMDTVADMVGISSRQVSTHMKTLESVGLLKRKRRRSGLGRLGRFVFFLDMSTGSTLPEADDQWKDVSSGSALPEVDRNQKPASSGSGASSPPEAERRHHRKQTSGQEPSVNPKTSRDDQRPPPDEEFSPVVCELTRRLAKGIASNGHKVPKPGTSTHRKWFDHIRKLLDLDEADPDEVRQVIDFATTDDFWRANIQSAAKFREKYSQLRIKAGADRARNAGTANGAVL